MKIMAREFSDIFANDPLGLLDTAPRRRLSTRDDDNRLVDGFAEITNFFETNNREPSENGDLKEFLLFSRLIGIRSNPAKVSKLLQFDFYNLLDEARTTSIPLEDLVQDDPLGILLSDDEDQSIFSLKHVKPSSRLDPEYVAHRQICKDFDDYRAALNLVAEDLAEKRRKQIEFHDTEVVPGRFYVLNGVLMYLEKMKVDVKTSDFSSGSRKRLDGRTRCIFDNGTESTMLMRSLVKALNRPHEGYLVSEVLDEPYESPAVNSDDIQSGYIYVLGSRGTDESIRSFKNLHKIGFSTGDVTKRISNAENEPTYLMAPVILLRSVRCFNVDPHRIEGDLHSFFSEVNIAFEIRDASGCIYHPKEWFDVSLDIIDEALELLHSGTIDRYKYDSNIKAIVLRS